MFPYFLLIRIIQFFCETVTLFHMCVPTSNDTGKEMVVFTKNTLVSIRFPLSEYIWNSERKTRGGNKSAMFV